MSQDKELTNEEMEQAAGGKQIRQGSIDGSVETFETQPSDPPSGSAGDVRRKIRRAAPPEQL